MFNKNDDPFANNCQWSLGLCFLINKALWILGSKLELHFFNCLNRIYVVFGISINIAWHNTIFNWAFSFQIKAQVFNPT